MTQILRTPIFFFNLVSGGGIRFGTLAEFWGANQSGKTTAAYQTAGYFMQDFPDGEVEVIDSEGSFDEVRSKYVFKLDLTKDKNGNYKRLNIIPAPTLEEGFHAIVQRVKDASSTPRLILWDTISTCATLSAMTNAREAKTAKDITSFSGGMMERQRVIKDHLRRLMGMIYGKPIIILLPNQIYMNVGGYGAKEISGEGSALKHDLHYSFHFKLQTDSISKDSMGLTENHVTNVFVSKSKFCPRIDEIPLYIDVTKGGLIDVKMSSLLMASKCGYIVDAKGWYRLKGAPEAEASVRWENMVEKADEFLPRIETLMLRDVVKKFFLTRYLYEDLGQGDKIKAVEALDAAPAATPTPEPEAATKKGKGKE